MPPDPATVDPAEAMLAELAGLDLTLARHVHARATATEKTGEVVELARAYQRVARSLRQTLALHAQLKRQRLAAAEPPAPPAPDWVRLRRRQGELRAAVCRVIWDETESESEDEDVLLDVLDATLQRGEDDPAFDAAPLDAHVLEVCAVMDLSLDKAERWRDLPDRSAHRRSRPSDELVDDEDDGGDEDEPADSPRETNGHAWRSSA